MPQVRLRLVSPDTSPASLDEEMLSAVFAALSDPVRRAILVRLGEGEQLVSQLAEPFDISLQAVSKHIQVLVVAGLVRQERSGRVSLCRIDAGPIFAAAVWLNRYSKHWQAQFDRLAYWLDQIERERDARAPVAGARMGKRRKSRTAPKRIRTGKPG
ncbi:MAG TPA: metalloregulator ArsR/SmtB family transcription factor [Steroidobacteraceae bacterium]|nr:metalloregulator ArsR/SmtB family transcription factor [Steroidobacteraceae bacterium]